MIGQDWKNPVLFLCGKSGKLDLLANWRKIWQAEKSAENLADPVKRKIWKIQNMENLENLECKVYLTFHGKSGARYSAENLTLICLENLQKMLALFIVMW